MNRKEITRQVKDLALSSGFDAVGICSADPLEEERARFLDWLNLGYAGSMSYLEREPERRLNPRQILPSAKSIIVLALNYFPSQSVIPAQAGIQSLDPRFRGGDSGQTLGRVAKYARGRDYHKILERRLRLFAAALKEKIETPFEAKSYVDAGPVMERPLARRAGVGFIGKHTLTITRQFGSWVFLSEIITDLDLEPDRPDLRDCGSCTKCIEACPTGAIVDEYKLDARKCISYLTIEHRGKIDPDLREKMGNWVFGCDVCQDVCPINHHNAKPAAEDDGPTARHRSIERRTDRTAPLDKAADRRSAKRRPTGAQPSGGLWLDLEDLLNMRDDGTFYKKFSGTPLTRTKREGLVRNAAIAAGNSQTSELIPALKSIVENDSSEIVKEAATWAVQKISRGTACRAPTYMPESDASRQEKRTHSSL